VPWVPILRAQPAAAVAWIHEPLRASVGGVLSALGGVGRVPGTFGSLPSPALHFGSMAVGAACLALLLLAARRERDAAESAAFVLMVLAESRGRTPPPILFTGRTGDGGPAGVDLGTRLGDPRQPRCAWPEAPPRRWTRRDVRVGPAGPPALADGGRGRAVARRRAWRLRPRGGVLLPPGALASERGLLPAPACAAPSCRPTPAGSCRRCRTRRGRPPRPPRSRRCAGARLFLVLPPPYQTEGVNRVLSAAGGEVRRSSARATPPSRSGRRVGPRCLSDP
jgi:hypothetical protein